MSAYLNLTVEAFFKECKERTILGKVRIAQKRSVETQPKTPPLFRIWFQLSSIDLGEGVVLRATVPISVSLSDPWSERVFEEDKKGYDESRLRQLNRIQEEAAKYYPGIASKEGGLKDGEWSWGE